MMKSRRVRFCLRWLILAVCLTLLAFGMSAALADCNYVDGDGNPQTAPDHNPGDPTEVPGTRVNSTCTTPGHYDTVTNCTRCGTEISRNTVTLGIDPNNHVDKSQWVKGDQVSPATCQSPAVYTYTCTCGNTSEQRPEGGVDPNNHLDKSQWVKGGQVSPATCQSPAVYTYTCPCGNASEQRPEGGADPNNHLDKSQWVKGDQVSPATCQSPAMYTYTCPCGNASEQRPEGDADPNNHADKSLWVKGDQVSPATCQSAAVYTYTCPCGNASEQRPEGDADPNAHQYENGACKFCGAEDPNYVFNIQATYTGGELTKVYDKTRNVTLKASDFKLSGIEEGHNVEISAIKASYDKADVGDRIVSISITLKGADADRYRVEDLTVPASITPKALVITPTEGQKKTYGANDPTYLTCKVKGLLYGDTVTGRPSRETGENVGKYKIVKGTIDAGSNYEVEVLEGYFTIEAKSINSSDVGLVTIGNQRYTGQAITPDITLRFGTRTLEQGTDFTVVFENNTEPGQATVKLTGMGNYTGERETSFQIIPVEYTVTFINRYRGVISATPYLLNTSADAIVRPETPADYTEGDYYYTFDRWVTDDEQQGTIVDVTADATYKPVYNPTLILKIVSFKELAPTSYSMTYKPAVADAVKLAKMPASIGVNLNDETITDATAALTAWTPVDYDGKAEGDFVFTATLADGGYPLADGVARPTFTLTFHVGPATASDGSCTYRLNPAGELMVVQWKTVPSEGKDAGVVSVPDKIDGHPVVGIAAGAFQNMASRSKTPMTKLVLPAGVRTVGDSAFADNAALKVLVVPDSLEAPEGQAMLAQNLLLNTKLDQLILWTDLNSRLTAADTVAHDVPVEGQTEPKKVSAQLPMAFTDIIVRTNTHTIECDYTVPVDGSITVKSGAKLAVAAGSTMTLTSASIVVVDEGGAVNTSGTVVNCAGTWTGLTPVIQDGGSYIVDHQYVDGVCKVCGWPDPEYIVQLEATYNGKTPTKAYDKSKSISLKASDFTLSGVRAGHSVEIASVKATCDKSDAGERTITASFTLKGSDAGLYTVKDLELKGKITPKELVVKPGEGQKKTYGTDDPSSLSYTTSGLESDDKVTGKLSRETGEEVGKYRILQGTLDAGSNYTISVSEGYFNIVAKEITISYSGASLTKVYDKTRNVSLKASDFKMSGVSKGDSVELSAIKASYDKADVGDRTVSVSFTLKDSGDAANYTVKDLTISAKITPKALVITPTEGQKKTYGANDPTYLTGKVKGLLSGDTVTGRLSRETGENVGKYKIVKGTIDAGANYEVEVLEGYFVIDAKSINSSDVGLVTIGNQRYTGKALTPDITLRFGTRTLVQGTDFKAEYKNNIQPGTATVKLTGTGNYTGERETTFRILKVSSGGGSSGGGSSGGGSSSGGSSSGGSSYSYDGFDDGEEEESSEEDDEIYEEDPDAGKLFLKDSVTEQEIDYGTILFTTNNKGASFVQFAEETQPGEWELTLIPDPMEDRKTAQSLYLSGQDTREKYDELHLRIPMKLVSTLLSQGYTQIVYELEKADLCIPLASLKDEIPLEPVPTVDDEVEIEGEDEAGEEEQEIAPEMMKVAVYDFCLEQIENLTMTQREVELLAGYDTVVPAYRLRVGVITEEDEAVIEAIPEAMTVDDGVPERLPEAKKLPGNYYIEGLTLRVLPLDESDLSAAVALAAEEEEILAAAPEDAISMYMSYEEPVTQVDEQGQPIEPLDEPEPARDVVEQSPATFVTVDSMLYAQIMPQADGIYIVGTRAEEKDESEDDEEVEFEDFNSLSSGSFGNLSGIGSSFRLDENGNPIAD